MLGRLNAITEKVIGISMDELIPLTLDQYRLSCYDRGMLDELNIRQSYRVYLAYLSEDDVEIEKSINNIYYNEYYRLMGRFN